MQPLTISDLQRFAEQQGSAERRISAAEDAVTGMVQRVVGPPIARLQENETAVQNMQARLVSPAADRLRANDKRMDRIRVKLAGSASQRTQENASVLTGQLARLGTQGFPASGGIQSVPGPYSGTAPVLPGKPDQGGGLAYTRPGSSTMGMPGTAQGIAPSAVGPGLARATDTGFPDLGAYPTYQAPLDTPIYPTPVGVPEVSASTGQTDTVAQQPESGNLSGRLGLPIEESDLADQHDVAATAAPAHVYQSADIGTAVAQICACIKASFDQLCRCLAHAQLGLDERIPGPRLDEPPTLNQPDLSVWENPSPTSEEILAEEHSVEEFFGKFTSAAGASDLISLRPR